MTDTFLNSTDNNTVTSHMTSSINPMSMATTIGGILNQTSESVTSEMTSITPMTIAAVSVVMVISSVAVVMNSGILVMTYWLKLINKVYRMICYVLITATDLTFSVYSIINCSTISTFRLKLINKDYRMICYVLITATDLTLSVDSIINCVTISTCRLKLINKGYRMIYYVLITATDLTFSVYSIIYCVSISTFRLKLINKDYCMIYYVLITATDLMFSVYSIINCSTISTFRLKLINKDYRMIYYVLITATDLTLSVYSIINCVTISTFRLKLINKDYRMIYYVLITATDLTFSVHSIINCVTIILRDVDFFKYKWFCLILQCSGTVSYQISAMSIILLVFDLYVSIRSPFSTETSLRRKLSYAACFVAIFVASSLAYGPFIWWYGSETKLDFCSIANVYGPYFTDYHKMATVVLALLFLLMIITSSLLLKEINLSIQPRPLRSMKIPAISKDDTETKSVRKLKPGRRNALPDANTVDDQVTDAEDQSDEVVRGSTLPDVVAGLEKVTMDLSSYVGIDNKAFDKEERISMRNKLLNIGANPCMDSSMNDGLANSETDELKDAHAEQNHYTEAYKSVAGIESESKQVLTNIKNPQKPQTAEENAIAVGQIPGYVNHAFDVEDKETNTRDGMSVQEPPVSMVLETPATTDQLDNAQEDKQRLSVDVEAVYRGSLDKVRRLTGTETVKLELKEIETARSEKRKKFLRACKTVAAFMTAYLGCGLPYYILSVVELSQGSGAEDSDERRTVRMICALFLYLLPIVDPILYTSRFIIIRQTLGKFLPKCCKSRQQN